MSKERLKLIQDSALEPRVPLFRPDFINIACDDRLRLLAEVKELRRRLKKSKKKLKTLKAEKKVDNLIQGDSSDLVPIEQYDEINTPTETE